LIHNESPLAFFKFGGKTNTFTAGFNASKSIAWVIFRIKKVLNHLEADI
jgi:hypothetical protein